MSYQYSLALQGAIYDRLLGFEPLKKLIGTAIYDRLPGGVPPDVFVLIGDEQVLDRSDKSAHASRHDVTVSVLGDGQGFSTVKEVAAQVSTALDNAALHLNAGALRQIQFQSAKTRRDGGRAARRIDLIFRAYIDET